MYNIKTPVCVTVSANPFVRLYERKAFTFLLVGSMYIIMSCGCLGGSSTYAMQAKMAEYMACNIEL